MRSSLFVQIDLANALPTRVGQYGTLSDSTKKITDIDFTKNGKIISTVSFIEYNVYFGLSNYPTNNFLIQISDNTSYNPSTNEGTSTTYDITGDPHLLLTHNYALQQTVLNEIPVTTENRSKLITLFPTDIRETDTQNRVAHYCDTNGNGNVTWSECYNCMRNACMSNPRCWQLCTWSIPAINQCDASMQISCIYISIQY